MGVKGRSIPGGRRDRINSKTQDAYFTPSKEVKTFLRNCEEINLKNLDKLTFWEPACGIGNISNVLLANGAKKVVSSDLYDYGFGETNTDFLITNKDQIDVIITNPPYKLAQEFIIHALTQAPLVIMFLRLSFLESIKRRDSLWNKYPFHKLYVCSKRPTLSQYGKKKVTKGGVIAYGWFVWKKDSQECKVKWI